MLERGEIKGEREKREEIQTYLESHIKSKCIVKGLDRLTEKRR